MFNNIYALGRAFNFTCLYIVIMTIIGELYKPIKISLASLTGHHWVSKGLTATILFLILAFVFRKWDKKNIRYTVNEITIATVVYSLTLSLFFVIFYYVGH